MKKRPFLSLFFCFVAMSLSAQNLDTMSIPALDSLYKHYENNEGDYEAAFACAQKILEKAQQTGSDTLIAHKELLLGQAYKNLGNYETALQQMQLSAARWRKAQGEQNADYAHILGEIGLMHYLLGATEQCKQSLDQALAIYKKIGMDTSIFYANTLEYMGIMYKGMGNYEDAEAFYRQSIDIQAKILGSEHTDYAISLNNLASLYQAMGQYGSAEPLFLQTLRIFKKGFGEQHPNCAIILNNLGILYVKTEQYPLAEKFFKEATIIDSITIGNAHPDYASGINNLAVLYQRMGREKEAIPILLKCLDIWEKRFSKQHSQYARGLYNLANAYLGIGRHKEAEALFKQSLAIFEHNLGYYHPNTFGGYNSLASFYQQTNNASLCLSYLYKALKNNSKLNELSENIDENWIKTITEANYKDYEQAFNSLNILYTFFYTNAKDSSTAYRICRSAAKLGEHIRNTFDTDADKMLLLSSMQAWVDKAIALAAAKPQIVPVNQAFSFAEQNKSILLADAIKGDQARSMGDLPDSLAAKELELQRQLSAIKKGLLVEKDAKEQSRLQDELYQTNTHIHDFKQQIEKAYPKYYQLKYAAITATAEQVQALLDPETALLEYFVSDAASYLFYLDKQQMQLYPLQTSNEELRQQITTLRKVLTDYNAIKNEAEKTYQNYTTSAFWFYNQLVKPVLKNQNIKKLIIVADGELGHLPFEAFLVEAAPNQASSYANLHYLMRDFSISYNYSATLWKENLQAPRKQNNGQLLAFAAGYTEQADSNVTRSPYLRTLRNALSDLPAAKSEVEALSKLFAGNFSIGKNATEAYFKSKAAEYGTIHLAMHGILNRRSPILSALVFTESADSSEDNFLEAWEVSQMKLNADLVVLSACETGYGRFEQGEGVASLARSFMYAGVPALVVSMWEVNDASTSQIMEHFYNNLALGTDKAEALRQAKIQYLSDAKGVAAHPAYWSAFVQIGDNRPISVARQPAKSMAWLYGAVGGGAVALLVVGLMLRNRQKRNN